MKTINLKFFKKKIITNLCGGLGNQLFQYAASKTLKKKCFNDVVEYISNDLKWNNFSDDISFFVNIKIKIIDLKKKSLIETCWLKIYRFFFCKINDENDTYLHQVPKSKLYLLTGYFQNYSWYKDSWHDVCDEIIFNCQKKCFDHFKESEIVLSFRRSDFVRSNYNLNLNYYYKILNIINKDKKKEITLVCEDVQFIDLFYEKLKSENYIINPIKLNLNFSRAINDFVTIIKSKSLILSNSTFAWWAAAIRSRIGYSNDSVFIPKYWIPPPQGNKKIFHPGNPCNWNEIDNKFG
jgi:hypothetical protein